MPGVLVVRESCPRKSSPGFDSSAGGVGNAGGVGEYLESLHHLHDTGHLPAIHVDLRCSGAERVCDHVSSQRPENHSLLVALAMRSSTSFWALSSAALLAGDPSRGPLVDSTTGVAPGYGVYIAL